MAHNRYDYLRTHGTWMVFRDATYETLNTVSPLRRKLYHSLGTR